MPKAKAVTVPLTPRAALQRINRKLLAEADGDPMARQIRVTRGADARRQLGAYYLVDPHKNAIVETDVDLEAFGRKLDALKPWEVVKGSGND